MNISVIIPAYNSEKTIINALDSVYAQTYPVYEIIIVNDGSTDNTKRVIEEYIKTKKIQNITLLNQSNKGVSAARNNAIIHAKGELIAFLDSDDCWKSQKTETQVSILKQNRDIKLIGCLINQKESNSNNKYDIINLEKLLFKNYFSTPTVLVYKNILLEFMFNEKQRYSEDYRLWLQIASLHTTALVNQSFVICGGGKPTFGHSGLSSKLWPMEKGELSNYLSLYTEKRITFLKYITVSGFSFIKYLRRVVMTKLM